MTNKQKKERKKEKRKKENCILITRRNEGLLKIKKKKIGKKTKGKKKENKTKNERKQNKKGRRKTGRINIRTQWKIQEWNLTFLFLIFIQGRKKRKKKGEIRREDNNFRFGKI